jgi:hypothetical protein
MAPVSDTPGRYQRSFPGLLGAMIVTLLVIGAFVAFRAFNRDNAAVPPEPVEWRSPVRYLQQTGVSVVYPSVQPAGWTATSANYRPDTHLEWDLGFLTDRGEFVGLHEEDASVATLVSDLVDVKAVEGDPVTLHGPVARTWRTYSDSGGDYALVAELGPETLVVFGTAEPQVIRDFAESLTTAPLKK